MHLAHSDYVIAPWSLLMSHFFLLLITLHTLLMHCSANGTIDVIMGMALSISCITDYYSYYP